jgi:hypothetical protein
MSSYFNRQSSSPGRFSSIVLIAGIAIAGLSVPCSLKAQQAAQVVGQPAASLVAAASGTQSSNADAQAPATQVPATQPEAPAISAPAPQTQSPQAGTADSGGKQTKRILGIMPNFRAVSADEKLPPETVKEKFIDATEDSFDYSSIFFPAVIAGYNMEKRATPQFHQGAAGFARYFWHSAVDQTSENYMVEFIFPAVTHEDSRYYTLGHGGFLKRTGYALSRAVVTRTDSGNRTFNVSEVFGAGAASGISNLYYPSASRTVGNTMSEWGLDVGIDSGVFWFREFWPDINRHIFHYKYGNSSPHQ